ncbi:MAG TPA: helix-turn-helix transcriptional regulator [Clostridia bacterium]|nr:helix-turn-helix transcriptional regulator [Clostridia bacterium]
MELGDYLTLRSTKLQAAETWNTNAQGLLFVFPRDGGGSLGTSSSQTPVSAGDLIIFCGVSGQKLIADSERHLTFSSFSVCFENLYPLFGTNELRLASSLEQSFKKTKFYPRSDTLSRDCHKLVASAPSQFNLDHRTHLLKIVANVLNQEFRSAKPRRAGMASPEAHIIQVFEQLSVTEILTLSVGDLATRFGCSRRHLNRLFHEYFSMSVAAMRMEMRLLKAVSLLREPETKIISVAEQCGFNHLGLFNTCFKRRFGSSPGQWRKTSITPPAPTSRRKVQDASCPLHLNGLCPWSGHKAGADLPKADHANHNPEPPHMSLKRSISVRVFTNAPSNGEPKSNSRTIRKEVRA